MAYNLCYLIQLANILLKSFILRFIRIIYYSFLIEYIISFNQYIFRNLSYFMCMGVCLYVCLCTMVVEDSETIRLLWIP